MWVSSSPARWMPQREGQEVQGRGAPDHLWDRRIPPPQSKGHLEELHVDVEKLSVRAAFAIAHMAAKANEHLTKLIRRDRAESLATQSDRLLSSYF